MYNSWDVKLTATRIVSNVERAGFHVEQAIAAKAAPDRWVPDQHIRITIKTHLPREVVVRDFLNGFDRLMTFAVEMTSIPESIMRTQLGVGDAIIFVFTGGRVPACTTVANFDVLSGEYAVYN